MTPCLYIVPCATLSQSAVLLRRLLPAHQNKLLALLNESCQSACLAYLLLASEVKIKWTFIRCQTVRCSIFFYEKVYKKAINKVFCDLKIKLKVFINSKLLICAFKDFEILIPKLTNTTDFSIINIVDKSYKKNTPNGRKSAMCLVENVLFYAPLLQPSTAHRSPRLEPLNCKCNR